MVSLEFKSNKTLFCYFIGNKKVSVIYQSIRICDC